MVCVERKESVFPFYTEKRLTKPPKGEVLIYFFLLSIGSCIKHAYSDIHVCIFSLDLS